MLVGSVWADGIQAKSVDYQTPPSINNEPVLFSLPALDIFHPLLDGQSRRLNRLFWITSGKISHAAWSEWELQKNRIVQLNLVELWSGEKLLDEIFRYAPKLISELDLLRLDANARELEGGRLWTAANRLHSDIFAWHIERKEVHEADEALQKATHWLLQEPTPSRFFSRVLFTRNECCRAILSHPQRLVKGVPLDDPKTAELVPQQLQSFWTDLMCIERQLRLLVEHHISPTSRLTSPRAALLALRAGFSPRSEPLANELKSPERPI